jgi:thiol-disulfide isomerase/thioredoxin
MKLLWTCLLVLTLAGAASAKTDQPTTRQSLQLTDINGTTVAPLHPVGHTANVLIFIRTDCPISNGYAPIINELVKSYANRGVVFYIVYTTRDLPLNDAKAHHQAFGYTCPAVIDRQHALVKALGAIATPEAFVITPDGSTAYYGRIDDSYPSLGKQRPHPTTHDLSDAIDTVLAGKTPTVAHTRAVGCAITED